DLVGSDGLLPGPCQGTVELPVEVDGLLHALCTKIDELGNLEKAAARSQRLRNIGSELGQVLLPASIRQALANHTTLPAATALHIASTDLWAPWELIWLGGAFLGEHFAVTRWLREGGLRHTLAGGRAVLVAPASSQLGVSDERRALTELSGGAPQELCTVAEVQRLVGGDRQVGFLHFACHGRAEERDPLGGKLGLDGGLLQPVDVQITDYGRGPLARACVFLNACQAEQPGTTLSGHAGWAKRFLRAGATVFVAPSWSVHDVAAA
ncbi:MAG: CHAT domain-containing protein, partial [Delftia sp.]|nr:CHAT domain-containing protein [Delftia sp.]